MSARTVTYASRPPASARAARRAWDHFTERRATAGRPIAELFHSPDCDHAGPHWICILATLPDDTMNWGFSLDCLTYTVPSHLVAKWERERHEGAMDAQEGNKPCG